MTIADLRLDQLTPFDKLIDRREVCRLIACSPRFLERMVKFRQFPKPDKWFGRHPRWRQSTVQRWIRESDSQQGRAIA